MHFTGEAIEDDDDYDEEREEDEEENELDYDSKKDQNPAECKQQWSRMYPASEDKLHCSTCCFPGKMYFYHLTSSFQVFLVAYLLACFCSLNKNVKYFLKSKHKEENED